MNFEGTQFNQKTQDPTEKLKACTQIDLVYILCTDRSNSQVFPQKHCPLHHWAVLMRLTYWSTSKFTLTRKTLISMICYVKEKIVLIWNSFLLEMDVYFQNIALAAPIYHPQRRSWANMCRQISIQVWRYTQAEGVLTASRAACHPWALL